MYIGDNHFVLNIKEEDTIPAIETFLEQYYLKNNNTDNVFIDLELHLEFIKFFLAALNIKINTKIPHNIRNLINMAQVNLKKIIDTSNTKFDYATTRLSTLLNNHPINKIECIDISHNNGDNTIASVVVFANGIIDHTQYRKFNLPNTIKGNDLLAMEYVYNHKFMQNNNNLPNVILVDGGKLQLNNLKKVLLKYNLCDIIKVVAIFKGANRNPTLDRLLLEDGKIVSYNEEKTIFNLLQNLRDEAHRFAITGHRKKQIKKMTTSAIDDIPNIGVIKRKKLLIHFGSAIAVSKASRDDLQKVEGIGKALADQIYSYFH